jgi:hypothetical protein
LCDQCKSLYSKPRLIFGGITPVHGDIAATYTKKYNISNASKMPETSKLVLEKWGLLTDSIDGGEALAKRYWQEVVSRIDANQYGFSLAGNNNNRHRRINS